jgi:NADPH-dependent 2,4-dienoyl-CoA reductase/sulfur reductase-like enzyme
LEGKSTTVRPREEEEGVAIDQYMRCNVVASAAIFSAGDCAVSKRGKSSSNLRC